METMENNPFSGPVSVFQESRMPEMALPVGYAALIAAYDLQIPLPITLCAIGKRHKVYAKILGAVFAVPVELARHVLLNISFSQLVV